MAGLVLTEGEVRNPLTKETKQAHPQSAAVPRKAPRLGGSAAMDVDAGADPELAQASSAP